MRVVNLKKEKCDFLGCRKRDNSIPYPPQEGFLGNPFFLNNQNDDNERNNVCDKYEKYFINKVNGDIDFRRAVIDLPNKYESLGCFCKPKRCHLDTVVQWLDVYKRVTTRCSQFVAHVSVFDKWYIGLSYNNVSGYNGYLDDYGYCCFCPVCKDLVPTNRSGCMCGCCKMCNYKWCCNDPQLVNVTLQSI